MSYLILLLILLLILFIISFFLFKKLFVKIDKFWLFMIFMFIYLTILKEGIKTNDLNLEYN